MLGGKIKLKEKLIDNNINETEEQFIFYDNHKEKKFQQQIEIQAVLNSNNLNKVMVIVDKKSTLNYLCIKIAEQMEKFQEYANLEGLKAVNLSKKSEKGIIKIPSSGEIKDYIIAGDIIYCDLATQEFWLKTNIKIFSSHKKMTINLELKFRVETLFQKLKFLLLKLGINFWIDYVRGQKDSFHYTFINAKFKTLKSKNNFELNINDLNKKNHIETMKIKDVFDFFSEIHCHINLISLEELLFNDLKNININSDSENKLRWNEFRDLTFDNLNNDKKFSPEMNFIKKYILKLMRSTCERIQKSFYVYNKNYYANTNHNLEDEELLKNIVENNDVANLIIDSGINDNELSKITRKKTELSKSDKKVNESTNKTHRSHTIESEYEENYHKWNRNNILDISKVISNFHNESAINPKNNLKETEISNCKNKDKDTKILKENFINESAIGILPEHTKQVSNYQLRLTNLPQATNDISLNTSKIESHHPTSSATMKDINTSEHNDSSDNKLEYEIIEKSEVKLNTSKYHRNSSNPQSQKYLTLLTNMRDTSKYSNLRNEFKSYLKSNKFVEFVNNYTSLKMAKNILERVSITQFRDISIKSENIENETKNSTTIQDVDQQPLSVNNKMILIFIFALLIVFIGAILFIFLYN